MILGGVATWEGEIMLERQREGTANAEAEGQHRVATRRNHACPGLLRLRRSHLWPRKRRFTTSPVGMPGTQQGTDRATSGGQIRSRSTVVEQKSAPRRFCSAT
jgi:hypothetical protein